MELSPSAVSFACDGSLLAQVDREGLQVLYNLDLNVWPNQPFGSVMDVTPMPGKSKQVLVSCDSFDSSRRLIIQDLPAQGSRSSRLPALSEETFSLSKSKVDQVWFPSDEQRQIHAWVVKPPYINPKQKYPLLYIIHGGPQHSWGECWDLHCYLALSPSTAISSWRPWAGKPYSDLERSLNYICQSLEYVDTERAVALGLGYGGYMVNWMQGHDLGRRFRALIADNGTFNMLSHLANNTQDSIFHGMGGSPWLNPEAWRKWDHAQFAGRRHA
ncbi:hypothetical protein PENFLA_c050G00358 [Penicillium flavigenum]|uniref:Dipeptidyl-peptidase V n=1 Tax=Penicillium flavigenum TaxID=254877 RepID=A0A1V6SH26_9EURO|nr:hypothetical protein PENFLA_c050G00358 [Penicillium flavigenum]